LPFNSNSDKLSTNFLACIVTWQVFQSARHALWENLSTSRLRQHDHEAEGLRRRQADLHLRAVPSRWFSLKTQPQRKFMQLYILLIASYRHGG